MLFCNNSILVFLLFVFDVLFLQMIEASKGNCSNLANVPQMSLGGRYAMSSASVGSNSYWFGGYSDTNALTSKIEVFNVATLTWSQPTPNLSAPKAYTMAGVLGTKIYIAGGRTSSLSQTAVVEVLDTTTYQFRTPQLYLSEARFSGAIVSLDGKLYIGGGASTDSYNPRSDNVDMINSNGVITFNPFTLGVKRSSLAGAACGTKVVFAGGLRSSPIVQQRTSNFVDIYDTATNVYRNGSWLSQGRAFLAGIGYGNQCFFAGGDAYTGVSATVDVYHATLDTWRVMSLSVARHSLAVESITNQLYFMGGRIFNGASSQVDIFAIETEVWTTSTLSSARSEPISVMLQDSSNYKEYIMVAGGLTASLTSSSANQIFSCTLPLQFVWNATDICSDCSNGCGIGTKTCQVYCIDQFQRRAFSESSCDASTKPGLSYGCTSSRTCIPFIEGGGGGGVNSSFVSTPYFPYFFVLCFLCSLLFFF
jgi:hypothetical protein